MNRGKARGQRVKREITQEITLGSDRRVTKTIVNKKIDLHKVNG